MKVETNRRRWLLRALGAAGILGAALILYLSWVPDSRMNDILWMPRWLGVWADNNRANSRTGLPFVVLGGATGMILVLRKSRRPVPWVVAWGMLIAVAAVAELGQIPIPTRTFTFEDIGWGSLGAGVGLGLMRLLLYWISGLEKSPPLSAEPGPVDRTP